LDETGDEEEKSTEEALKENLTPSKESLLPSNDGSIDYTLQICNQPKQRGSIWGLLLRNNKHLNSFQEQDPALTKKPAFKSEQQQLYCNNTVLLNDTNKTAKEITKTKSDVRRKKSLSTPNLPISQFLTLDKQSSDKVSNLDLKKTKTPESKTLENPKRKTGNNRLNRSRSVHDKCLKRENVDDAKEKISWSMRIKRNTRDLVSNSSLNNGESEAQVGKVRFGTIARKVQDRKAKETQRDKKKERK